MPQKKWYCPACSFLNENALHLSCAACGTARLPSGTKQYTLSTGDDHHTAKETDATVNQMQQPPTVPVPNHSQLPDSDQTNDSQVRNYPEKAVAVLVPQPFNTSHRRNQIMPSGHADSALESVDIDGERNSKSKSPVLSHVSSHHGRPIWWENKFFVSALVLMVLIIGAVAITGILLSKGLGSNDSGATASATETESMLPTEESDHTTPSTTFSSVSEHLICIVSDLALH